MKAVYAEKYSWQLYDFKFQEDVLVAGDRAIGHRIGETECGALVRNLVAYLMRLPRVLQRSECFRIDRFELLADCIALVAELGQHIVEHDIGLDDGLSPFARRFPAGERFYLLPARVCAARVRRQDERMEMFFFALSQLEETNGRIDDEKKPDDGDSISGDIDPDPDMREPGGESRPVLRKILRKERIRIHCF